MTTFSTQSRMIFHRACGNDSYVDLCFSVCPSILPFICMTCYDFDAFLYMVFDFFVWYFTHGISETWIPPVFIFSWLWPQLYYLFHVFSIVNIYKTLNKLFKIAFCNLPLHVSRMKATEKYHRTYPVSQNMRIHFPRRIKGPWLVFSFVVVVVCCCF